MSFIRRLSLFARISLCGVHKALNGPQKEMLSLPETYESLGQTSFRSAKDILVRRRLDNIEYEFDLY